MKISKKLILASTLCASVLLGSVSVMANPYRHAQRANMSARPLTQSMSYNYGTLEEYQKENLKRRKEILDAQVANGYLTRQQADAMYNQMELNQQYCTGGGGMLGGGCGGGRYYGIQ